MFPRFENISLRASAIIGILEVDISNDVQVMNKKKRPNWPQKLWEYSADRQYFTQAHRLQLYKAQISGKYEVLLAFMVGGSTGPATSL